MFTPNPLYEEIENASPEWHEPFPKPQTIPAGWDLSEILSTTSTNAAANSEVNAKS
jgi:hypothetical protein